MDTSLMQRYVDYLNDARVKNGTREDLAMLVYDSFRGHLEDSIKKRFRESNVYLAVIPGGLTSKCQPLDVSINKPFKEGVAFLDGRWWCQRNRLGKSSSRKS